MEKDFEKFYTETLSNLKEMMTIEPFDDEERKDIITNIFMEAELDSKFVQSLLTLVQEISKQVTFEIVNRCIICQEDIGIENPRQLCRKTFCANGAAAPKKRKRSESPKARILPRKLELENDPV
jgi:hypothetical protein